MDASGGGKPVVDRHQARTWLAMPAAGTLQLTQARCGLRAGLGLYTAAKHVGIEVNQDSSGASW